MNVCIRKCTKKNCYLKITLQFHKSLYFSEIITLWHYCNQAFCTQRISPNIIAIDHVNRNLGEASFIQYIMISYHSLSTRWVTDIPAPTPFRFPPRTKTEAEYEYGFPRTDLQWTGRRLGFFGKGIPRQRFLDDNISPHVQLHLCKIHPPYTLLWCLLMFPLIVLHST